VSTTDVQEAVRLSIDDHRNTWRHIMTTRRIVLTALLITVSATSLASTASARDCLRFPQSCNIARVKKIELPPPCIQCGVTKLNPHDAVINPQVVFQPNILAK
jgi:hypothetical protein